MSTFAERLKQAFTKKGISQSAAAKICGLSQQSLSYIISNNLESSKLAPQIASSLGINPEWLMLGIGKFEETKLYEIPILHSIYMLKKYINDDIDLNTVEFLFVNESLGNKAFAYIIESNKLIICQHHSEYLTSSNTEYLCINNFEASIKRSCEGELWFPIYEWRIRCVDF